MLSGEPVRGNWYDRTAEYRAKLRGEAFEPRRYATEETVVLSQLPCWRHLSPEKYRELVAGLVKEIDADAAAERKRTGRQPLGAATILRQHPHTWPDKTKKSPAPRYHAATKEAREAFRKAPLAALVAAGKRGAGDFFVWFGQVCGCWRRMAVAPSGSRPVRFRSAAASASISWTNPATNSRYASGLR